MDTFSVRKYILIVITAIFAILLKLELSSQTIPIRFQNLTIEDGLSQSKIYCILQDRKGFMWFGTQDGLNMYNGYDFKIFRNEYSVKGSISDKQAISIYEDKDGNIWVGTYYGGLNRFDYVTGGFVNYQIDSSDAQSINKNTVNCIEGTRNGEIWIGTYGSGLKVLNRKNEKLTTYKNNPADINSISNDIVTAIKEDSNNKLWIGTRDGLNLFDPINKTFKKFQSNPNDPNALSKNTINCLLIDNLGNLWVGTDYGLNQYDTTSGHIAKYFHNPDNPTSISNNKINCLYEDQYHRLWIGTEVGLNLFNNQTNSFTCFYSDTKNPNSISQNDILSICEDRTGTIWIGTHSNGLSWFETIPKGFITYRNIPNDPTSLNDNNVRCCYEESKEEGFDVWIGTGSGGLSLFNRVSNTFKAFKHNPKDSKSISSNRVLSLLKDRYGDLWVGTEKGLNKFNYKQKNFIHYFKNPKIPTSISDNRINVLYEDRNGGLWIGTENGGLNKYDRQKNQFISFKKESGNPKTITDNQVRSILEDHNGTLWIGTLNGLNIFNPLNNEFLHFFNNPKDTNSLSSDRVLSIYEDKSNRIWIATVEGINLYDKTDNKFIRYNQNNGFPNNITYCFLEDNSGNLWISSNRGISKFNPTTKKIINFEVNDGLQGNEFNYGAYLKTKSGEMFFGGTNGFTIFHPDSIKNNQYKPPIALTDFKLFNKSVPIGEKVNGKIILKKSINETEEIDLSHRDYMITIEFAALHYVSPKKNRYAYKLEGLEDNWNYVNNKRSVTYSTLPAGKYTFRVKGSNNDGVWNEEGKSIKITVHPPWWKTYPFLTFISLLFIFSVYSLFRMWYRKLKRDKILLEEIVEERTKDLHEVNTVLEEKQAELEIKQEEISAQSEWLIQTNEELKKLSIATSETSNAISIYSESGKLEWFNNAFQKIYGYPFNDFVKFRGDNIVDCSFNPKIKEYVDECYAKKKSVIYETKFKNKLNEIIWVQTTLTPIIDERGKVERLIGIDSDITELIKAEQEVLQKSEEIQAQNEKILVQNEELENHRNNLEELIRVRTHELEIAKQKAEDANRLKTSFLANMSHEIRTPMNAIVGFSALLNNPDCSDEDKTECIDQICSNSDTLLNLINDIIDLSKIQSNQLDIRIKAFELNHFLDEIYKSFQNQAIRLNKKNLSFRIGTLSSSAIWINSDPLRLRQIITNLLSNALKFTYEGYVEFGYNIENNTIQFYVKDTGIGIPIDKKDLIFTRFTKLEDDKTRLYRGAGLGLAISSHLVNILNGIIWVDSATNIGSTFYFTIPYDDTLTIPIPSSHLQDKQTEPANLNWSKHKVLIAEDEETNYALLHSILKKTGINMIWVKDGVEAVEYFMQNAKEINLILMDIKMPTMNGIDALIAIRNIDPKIPVVAQTAFAMNNEIEDIKSVGFDEYLVKPINPSHLFSLISKYLK